MCFSSYACSRAPTPPCSQFCINQELVEAQSGPISHILQEMKEGLTAEANTSLLVISFEDGLGLPIPGYDVQDGHFRIDDWFLVGCG